MLSLFTSLISHLTKITKWIALISMTLMMSFIAIAVISRAVFIPIIGDVELVRLGMVILIMCGLAYTQHVDGHISIGLLVDKFSNKVQKIFDVFASLLIMVVAITIAFVFINVGIKHQTELQLSTDLLSIPFYPLDFIIVLGFTMWALEALLKLITSITEIINDRKEA